ncbi:hypothetical protein LSTR_LSTR001595 [Laodelphax striatellus]|uniref:Uncharacterized protein n=1 Tax=Laodelphax striatellus TaxID=195883 RepID=A0A482XBX3_LAOST|nr:hypothetical protein LSTR_LSTR001595 [Laodelphax striatellus]
MASQYYVAVSVPYNWIDYRTKAQHDRPPPSLAVAATAAASDAPCRVNSFMAVALHPAPTLRPTLTHPSSQLQGNA